MRFLRCSFSRYGYNEGKDWFAPVLFCCLSFAALSVPARLPSPPSLEEQQENEITISPPKAAENRDSFFAVSPRFPYSALLFGIMELPKGERNRRPVWEMPD